MQKAENRVKWRDISFAFLWPMSIILCDKAGLHFHNSVKTTNGLQIET